MSSPAEGTAAETQQLGPDDAPTHTTHTPTTTTTTHTTTHSTTPTTTLHPPKQGQMPRKKQFKFYDVKSLRQTTLTPPSTLDQHDRYGDDPNIKRSKHIRLASGSLAGFHVKPGDKDRETFRCISDFKLDGLGLFETGLDWRITPDEDHWYQRHSPVIKKLKTSLAHNTMSDPISIQQWGGVATSVGPELIPRATAESVDPSGLGRWSSILIGGKKNHAFRIVNAYIPCDNASTENTVYRQHKLHLQRQGDLRLPRTAMLEDLYATMSAWLAAGELLMVFMDANEDIRTGEVNSMFRSLNLREMISQKHGSTHPMPATQIRNTSSRPIDGVWSNLPEQLRCGYLAFTEGVPGDHRTMWIDIPFSIIFGYTPPHLHKVFPPDLTTEDPRIRKKYNQRVHQLLSKWGTLKAVKKL